MRSKIYLFLFLAFPLLTGWGHWGPQAKVGLSLDRVQGREVLLDKLKEELEESRADLLVADAKGDPATQEKQVKDLIHRGVQTLIVLAADPSKAAPLVEAAHQSGIKVLSLENLIPGGLDYLVAFNGEKAGALQAKALAGHVPEGSYLLSGNGPPCEGWLKTLKPFVDRREIHIVGSLSTQSALRPKSIETYLKNNKEVAAILASDAETTQAAALALEKNGLSGKIALAGMGEDLNTCRRIASGAQLMTIYHPPQKLAEETAYLAAKLARQAKEFDCQFTEMDNDGSKTLAVLLTPLAVDAKNLDSTIIKDGVQKKDEVYGK